MRILYLLGFTITCIFALSACNSSSNPVSIENAWIREAPPGASAMAGYMHIINSSDDTIILQKADSPDFRVIEFHRSIEKNSVYKMEPHLHIHLAANSTFELKPGDYHLMMLNPKKMLKAGDVVKISSQFSGETTIMTEVPVKKAKY